MRERKFRLLAGEQQNYDVIIYKFHGKGGVGYLPPSADAHCTRNSYNMQTGKWHFSSVYGYFAVLHCSPTK